MGALLEETARARGMEVVAAFGSKSLDRLASLGKTADAVIDFSSPGALGAVAEYVLRTGTALVSGTTGYDEAQLAALRALGEGRAGAPQRQLLPGCGRIPQTAAANSRVFPGCLRH
jgi:4-hydroxy-tetrahydrodipicolinate reductase